MTKESEYKTPGPRLLLIPPDELDRRLAETLFPHLVDSQDKRDQVRLQVAMETIRKHRRDFMEELRDAIKFMKQGVAEKDEELEKANQRIKEMQAVINTHQSELRAAQEARGLYESKRVAGLENDVANRDRAIAELKEAAAKQQEEARGLANEIVGWKAKCDGIQRDLEQLMTVTTTQMQERKHRDEAAAQHRAVVVERLQSALDNISDRYGDKPGAFIEMIIEDIAKAKELLS